MIRSFMPFDVVDLLVAGRALSNKAKTRDGVGRKDARVSDLASIVGDWFNPQLRPCAWVYTEGLALRGLASVRDRRGPHAWEINRLLVADQDRNCCLKLLEHVSLAGGRLEVGRIFLRLSTDSPLLKAAQETGFLSYSTEHVYLRERADGTETKSGVPSASSPRRKKVDDEYHLFGLYHACVPPHVRRVEGMTYKEWQSNRDRSPGQEWVFEKDGDLVAWVATDADRHCGHLDVLAAAGDEMQSAVEYGLDSLSGCQQVCCLAPDFDGALLRLLEDRGFGRVTSYSVLAKELLVRVVEPLAMPAVPA
ncbi:MAG: hypothetical protein JW753_10545 [Dehalococcoidia bacterium]|nr:hypothetical protein [Dehalococcoidia bacterium]